MHLRYEVVSGSVDLQYKLQCVIVQQTDLGTFVHTCTYVYSGLHVCIGCVHGDVSQACIVHASQLVVPEQHQVSQNWYIKLIIITLKRLLSRHCPYLWFARISGQLAKHAHLLSKNCRVSKNVS